VRHRSTFSAPTQVTLLYGLVRIPIRACTGLPNRRLTGTNHVTLRHSFTPIRREEISADLFSVEDPAPDFGVENVRGNGMEMNGASPEDPLPNALDDKASDAVDPAHTEGPIDGPANVVERESAAATEASDESGPADALHSALGALTEQVSRFHERSARSEEIIRTMQSRITDLQGDQVQALLKPTIQRFAGLHAQAAEARHAAIERNENAAADFSFFMTSIEDALGLIDFDSVGAAVGVAFDSTRHHATSVAATGDATLDKTIQRVIRQGFTHADATRVSIPAQVTIYQYDESLSTIEPTLAPSPDASPALITDPSIAL
jgi:molecular chaperone GrpE (heat shock protein)